MTTQNVVPETRSALPRGLIVVLGTAGVLVTILCLQQFASILAPVLLALVLVIGVHPLTGILQRRGVPQWLALTITLLTVFAVVLGLAASFAVSVAQLATLLPTYQARFTTLVADVQAWLMSVSVGPEQVQVALDRISLGNLVGLLLGLLSGLAATFSDLLFLLLVVAFMGLDSVHFSRRLAQIAPQRAEIVAALGNFVRGTRSYLVVSTVFGLIVAAVDAGFLWLVGVPLPLLWGLLAFITNYIPNIGFVIGLVPPAILALLEGGPQLMIVVILVYSVVNFVIQSIIQPKYVSDAVDLSLTLTFLSLVFWSFVIGPLGAVLAIPLTLLSKALLLDVDPSTRWISSLLASGPGTTDAPPQVGEARLDTRRPGAEDSDNDDAPRPGSYPS
jgi:AI-2 transport protein TqsA